MSRSRDAEPAPTFHELIHAPVRLRICGLLRPVDELEFAVLRDTLQLKDANLSKNLSQLAEAGLVSTRKEFSPARDDARRLTWVSLTAEGHTALAAHLAALRAIAEGDPALPG
ncbi:transcriptional regulator [Brachybacterium massiliense]|uniref:transcriptional regulator n=1 Tax=Brachybacterium massiliense TaxID=1755098 RepID=UPI000B3BCB8D|nr:transcriptional regulator [Brachybacterium massiliense]